MRYKNTYKLQFNKSKIKRGEIYRIDLEKISIGSMQSGIRHCLIVSNDKCNEYSPTITVLPLTTQVKNNLPTHCRVKNLYDNRYSLVLGECITTVDKSLVEGYMGEISKADMMKVNLCMLIQLGIHMIHDLQEIMSSFIIQKTVDCKNIFKG